MTEWKDLHDQEQRVIVANAAKFYHRHKRHVNELMSDRVPSIAPSGSDLNHPELWKPIHWNWFMDHFVEYVL